MTRNSRTRILLVVVALIVGGVVWTASTVQRRTADTGRNRQAASALLLTGMLDQETGLRGYLLTGRDEFLQPFYAGRREYETALFRLRALATHRDVRDRLAAADGIAERWFTEANTAIAARRRSDAIPAVGQARDRKRLMDSFRAVQARLDAAVNRVRLDDSRRAGDIATATALILALLVGLLGDLVLGRRDREARRHEEAENAYRRSQTEFTETMQVVENEHEAHALLKRHLERELPEAGVVVLNHNNSADRLEPVTRVDDADLAERMRDATLMRMADRALYSAKEHGRDRVETATGHPDKRPVLAREAQEPPA